MTLQSGELNKAEVLARRARALAPAEEPAAAALAALDSANITVEQLAQAAAPAWLPMLCQLREHFTGIVFTWEPDIDGADAWLFMYATKSPYHAMFLSLQRQDMCLPPVGAANPADWFHTSNAFFRHSYVASEKGFVDASALGPTHATELWVIQELTWAMPGQLVGDLNPEPFNTFIGPMLRGRAPRAARAEGPATRRSKETTQTLVDEHPWITQYLKASSSDTRRGPTLPMTEAEPADEASAGSESDLDDDPTESPPSSRQRSCSTSKLRWLRSASNGQPSLSQRGTTS